MTQVLLEKNALRNEAGQKTISQEDLQRKIIRDQGLKLWLYYGENTIPLEREGTTHIITVKREHSMEAAIDFIHQRFDTNEPRN